MKEQPLFAPGDRAVCVNSKGRTTLIEGSEYTILKIKRQECCGLIGVWIGTTNAMGYECKCGADHLDGEVFYHQTRFIPVDFDKYADEVLHESLKGKPVVKHELN